MSDDGQLVVVDVRRSSGSLRAFVEVFAQLRALFAVEVTVRPLPVVPSTAPGIADSVSDGPLPMM